MSQIETTRPGEEAVPAHYRRLQPLAWDGFAFLLPPRWEVTGYNLADGRRGALQLHAGARYCGELSWRPIEGAPDAPLIIADALNRAANPDGVQGALRRPTVTTIGEWQLGCLEEGGERVALLWQAARSRVLMWVFGRAHDGPGLREIVELLGSFEPNKGERRRWRLFGAGCVLPSAFEFDALQAQPGLASLQFVNSKRARVTARRFGMIERSLADAGGLQAFYAGVISLAQYRLLDIATEQSEGGEEVRVKFEYVGVDRLDKLMGAWVQGVGWMWHERDEDRLYAWEISAPKAKDLEGLDDACE
jgi:hypothetical protein